MNKWMDKLTKAQTFLSKNPVLANALMIVCGVILFIWPNAVTWVLRLLGIAVLANGGLAIYRYQKGTREEDKSLIRFGGGIILAVLGLIVLISPRFLLSFIPTITGILIIAYGILQLFRAQSFKKEEETRWKWMFGISIVTIIGGVIILANPFSTVNYLLMAVGGALVYNGVVGLWMKQIGAGRLLPDMSAVKEGLFGFFKDKILK
ncbi:MAG: DUF308 domain-containing protein [Lachnospiraceae bacterium]|nr:DUF308 domain-containing protein [Lachnospiraceae bacterium]